MALTTAQAQALGTFIAGDATLSALPNTGEGNSAIAEALKATASPAFWVWKSRMTRQEIYAAFVWSEVIVLSAGKTGAMQMLLQDGTISPADANIRAGFAAIFAGTTTLTQLTSAAMRQANRLEKALATGPGTTASPATMGYEGSVTYQDVTQARGG